MAEGQVIYPRARRERPEYRQWLANGSYSVIIVIISLIAMRPLMVSQIVARAEAYSSFHLYDESKRQCDKVLLIHADNSRAWYLLARIYRAQGDHDAAYGAYHTSVEADSSNVPAHFELALMYVEDDQPQQAVPYFDHVRQLEAERAYLPSQTGFAYHRAALDMLVLCYERVGDPAKAAFTREELRVFYPHHTPMGTPKAVLTEALAG